MRILVCEDDRRMAELVSLSLLASDYEVLVRYNGLSAMDAACEWRPHAAIIDVGLPDVSGYAVAQYIRELPFGGDVLLVALTAYNHPCDVAMAGYAGFNWHFGKPARLEFIHEVLLRPERKPTEERDGTRLNPMPFKLVKAAYGA